MSNSEKGKSFKIIVIGLDKSKFDNFVRLWVSCETKNKKADEMTLSLSDKEYKLEFSHYEDSEIHLPSSADGYIYLFLTCGRKSLDDLDQVHKIILKDTFLTKRPTPRILVGLCNEDENREIQAMGLL